MRQILKKLTLLPWRLRRWHENRNNQQRLQRITDEAAKLSSRSQTRVRILFGPSFSPYHVLKQHDILLCALLAAKGAEIAYTATPFGLPACDRCGGVLQLAKTPPALCEKCQRFQRNDTDLVRYLSKFTKIYRLNDFLDNQEIAQTKKEAFALPDKNLEDFTVGRVKLGKYASDLIKNLKLVGNISLVEGHENLQKLNIAAGLVFYKYFQRVLESFRPEVVITHDAFYAPWAILHDLSQQNGIPVYNYYPGLRDNTFFYAKNRVTFELDIDELFQKWKNRKIKESELVKIEKIFAQRKKGYISGANLDTQENKPELQQFQALRETERPTAVLYASTIWDLASLNKEATFASIQETYLETIRFFLTHPEYNLIIKPHPADELRVYRSRESTAQLVQENFPVLPENILLLTPKTVISAYELAQKSKVSLTYTSTIGIESVILGTPTIVLGKAHYRGKGFTYDPNDKKEFETLLQMLLDAQVIPNLPEQIQLAKKYFYLFNYVNWHDFKIMKYNYKIRNKAQIIPNRLEDLLRNKDFLAIAETIINKQEIPFFDSHLQE